MLPNLDITLSMPDSYFFPWNVDVVPNIPRLHSYIIHFQIFITCEQIGVATHFCHFQLYIVCVVRNQYINLTNIGEPMTIDQRQLSAMFINISQYSCNSKAGQHQAYPRVMTNYLVGGKPVGVAEALVACLNMVIAPTKPLSFFCLRSMYT